MTTIEQIMKERDITVYRLMLLLGLNPAQNSHQWSQKLSGKRRMDMMEIEKMCKAISEYTKGEYPPLTARHLQWEVKFAFMK